MSTQEKISERVKAARKRLHMTQEQFAQAIGFTRSYISQIEAGLKEPGGRFLRDLGHMESGTFAHSERSPSQQSQTEAAPAENRRQTMISLNEEGGTYRPAKLTEVQLCNGVATMMQWFLSSQGKEVRLPLLRTAQDYLDELEHRESRAP